MFFILHLYINLLAPIFLSDRKKQILLLKYLFRKKDLSDWN